MGSRTVPRVWAQFGGLKTPSGPIWEKTRTKIRDRSTAKIIHLANFSEGMDKSRGWSGLPLGGPKRWPCCLPTKSTSPWPHLARIRSGRQERPAQPANAADAKAEDANKEAESAWPSLARQRSRVRRKTTHTRPNRQARCFRNSHF